MLAITVSLVGVCLFTMSAATLQAAEWHVSPAGRSHAAGTEEAPWDLASTLAGDQKVVPGDTVWLLAGTYKHPNRESGSEGYTVKLCGQKGQPIHVRGEPGRRVTIDGGLSIKSPSTHLWIRDLEIVVSENFSKSRTVSEPGSHPKSYNRPWGGLNIYSGEGSKYINLVIHDNAQGVSFWSGATNSELYGCIIHDNGWKGPDRGHGHAVYTQNRNGLKTIADCIMTGGYGYSLHAYGSSKAYVNDYLLVGNIVYTGGRFLIGGGRPSRGIRVLENILYRVPMQLGWNAPHNQDCEVRENIIVGSELIIKNFREVTKVDNLVFNHDSGWPPPRAVSVKIRPNRYDTDRANVAVYNGARQPLILLDPDEFLDPGDYYRLMSPCNMYGDPVVSGRFRASNRRRDMIRVPMRDEFAAFVLLKSPVQEKRH